MSTGKKVAIGAGVVALAAAGIAGAYLLTGKDGAKNRKKLQAWATKAKHDVLKGVNKAKIVSEKNYTALTTLALSKYAKVKKLAPAEVAMLKKEIKSHWKTVKAELAPKVSKVKAVLKKKRA